MKAEAAQQNNPYKKANIFNKKDYERIVSRIHALSDSCNRQWGTMTLPEMLEHCTLQLKLALHEIKGTKHEGPFILRTSFGKWIGLYGPRWSEGSITPSQMNIKKQGLTIKSLNDKRLRLLTSLDSILAKGEFQEHPFFGKLNKKDWGRLIWKHLDHHLRQFGV